MDRLSALLDAIRHQEHKMLTNSVQSDIRTIKHDVRWRSHQLLTVIAGELHFLTATVC